MGPTNGQDVLGKRKKLLLLPGFEHRTAQQFAQTLYRTSYPVLCIAKKPAEKMYKGFWLENP
jgi:hypothetical protein